jgi:hypothetical protein
MWNEQLAALQSSNTRKISTLQSLLEEQTREMVALRRERGEFVAGMESARTQEARERERLGSQLHALGEQLAEAQRREAAHVHAQSLLHNEIGMMEERARADIAALLSRAEQAATENHKLRALYTGEKARADSKAAELASRTEELVESHRTAEAARATAHKYKSKARELVDRVRAADARNEALERSAAQGLAEREEAQHRAEIAVAQAAQRAEELTALHGAHERLREELLGKTRELSALYQQYAAAVAQHQQDSQAHAAVLSHHSLISTLSSPLSHSLQLDLHRALADKQQEILDLNAQLDQAHRERREGRRAANADAWQQELHALRLKLERKTEENLRLHTENRDVSTMVQLQCRGEYLGREACSDCLPQFLSLWFWLRIVSF